MEDVDGIIKQIKEIFNSPDAAPIYERIGAIRAYSQNIKVVNVLRDYFEGLYRLLIEVDIHNKNRERASELYGVICTILINIVSYEDIDFAEEIRGDIAGPVLTNMRSREREIDTIWFVANILYRKNKFSAYFMENLVKNKIAEYLKNRVNLLFQSASENTIFYYFVGSVIANLNVVKVFKDFKVLLESVVYLSELEIDECYLYILDGLTYYAGSFREHQYEIFVTSIFKKCESCCKNKKSRFVSKYLTIVSNFLKG